ncbi:MAG: PH domain-containing protein [Candidatus Dadabacteria bacterium]|nr:MAG: PH domain-containing protein [Candidatus Dadabacteria bacterium]
MAFYPSCNELLFNFREQRGALTIHRSLRSVLSHFALFLILLCCTYPLYKLIANYRSLAFIPLLRYIPPGTVFIFPTLVLLEVLRKYHNDLYILKPGKISHIGGRLAMHHIIPVVKYSDIRAIVVEQDILGRLFDYGRIEIQTAALDDPEIIIEGVLAPHELADLIDQIRAYYLKSGQNGDSGD